MADTHHHPLRRLLDRLRHRPDEPAAEPQPAPVDPETIHSRGGTLIEIAGLSPPGSIEPAEGDGRR